MKSLADWTDEIAEIVGEVKHHWEEPRDELYGPPAPESQSVPEYTEDIWNSHGPQRINAEFCTACGAISVCWSRVYNHNTYELDCLCLTCAVDRGLIP